MRRASLAPLLVGVLLLAAGSAQAAPGALDASFGASGKVTTAIQTDEAHAVALEPNGKIVVAGESSNYLTRAFALVRYDPDVSLDTGFGTGGKVTSAIGPSDSQVTGSRCSRTAGSSPRATTT